MGLKNRFKFLFKRSMVAKFFVLCSILISSTLLDCNSLISIRNTLLASTEVLDELVSLLEKRVGKQEALNIVEQQYNDQIIKDYSDLSKFKDSLEIIDRTYGKDTTDTLIKQNLLLKKYLIYGKGFYDLILRFSCILDKDSFIKFIDSQRTLDIIKITQIYLKDLDFFKIMKSKDFINMFCNSLEISLETFETALKILCLDENSDPTFYLYPQKISDIILDHVIDLYNILVATQNFGIYNFIYNFKYNHSVFKPLTSSIKYHYPLFALIENPNLKMSGISFKEYYSLSYNNLFPYLKNVLDVNTSNYLEQDPEFNAYIDSLSLINLEKFKLSVFILYNAFNRSSFNDIMLKHYKNFLNFLKYLCSFLSNTELDRFSVVMNDHKLLKDIFYLSSFLKEDRLQDLYNILNYLSEILTPDIFLNYISKNIENLIHYVQQNTNSTTFLIEKLRTIILDVLKTHNEDIVYRILNSNPDKLLNPSSLQKLLDISECASLFSF